MNMSEQIGIGTKLIGNYPNYDKYQQYEITGETRVSWKINDRLSVDKKTLIQRAAGKYSPARFYTPDQWQERQRHSKAWRALMAGTEPMRSSDYTAAQIEAACAALGIEAE
jgi:hypothetical protein